MSYILDALRKSEQERQRGRLPDIGTLPEQPAPSGSRRTGWLILVALTLLNIAGVGGWWWTARTPGDAVGSPPRAHGVAASAPDTSEPASVSSVATVPPAASSPPAATVDSRLPAPDTATFAASRPITDALQGGTLIPAQPYQQVIVIPQGTSAVVQSPASGQPVPVTYAPPVASAPPAVSPPTTADPVMPPPPPAPPLPPELARPIEPGGSGVPDITYLPKLEELPPALRSRVPAMTFSSHLYSSMEQFRSVVINGQRMRQGSTLQPGLELATITENGVVLIIDGTSFQVDILGNWSR